MKNIFENAKFGDIYVSKDGNKNCFCSFTNGNGDQLARLYRKGWGVVIFYLDGSVHSGTEFGKGIDFTIVNRWKEPVSEEGLDKLIMNIQVHVCAWNFGGIDKTPYKDITQYVKEKLNEGLLKEWMNYEHQNNKKDDSAPSQV